MALLSVAGMLATSAVTFFDVGSRYLFNAPLQGFYEIFEMIMAVALTACFPVAFALRNHLTIDLLKTRLPARVSAALEIVGGVYLLAFLALVTWRLGIYAGDMAARGGVTPVARLPTAPFWWACTAILAICIPIHLVAVAAQFRRHCLELSEASDADRPPAAGELLVWGGAGLITLALLVEFGTGGALRPVSGLLPGEATALAVVLFGAMLALTLLLFPLAVAMGLVAVGGLFLLIGPAPALSVVGQQPTSLLANVNLATLPLFMLMGSFGAVGGLSDDVYRLAHALVGHRPGGLALATIVGCAGFGAVSGSSLATAATMGRIALPEMRSRGYADQLATGCIAAGGTLGMLVPPSSMMVIYAFLAEVAISDMFIAALVPAVVTALFYMAAVYLQVRWRPSLAPGSPRSASEEILRSIAGVWQVAVLFAVVIGGMYVGVFTATEAAAVGAGCAFLFALLRGRLTWAAFRGALADTAANTAMLYLLVFAAATFSQFVTISLLPSAIVGFMQSLGWPELGVIALILLMYVFLGCIMDPITMLLITIPVVIPVIVEFDMNLVWWGIVTILVVEIGLITPPVGMNVFVIKAVAGDDVGLTTVFKGVAPFLGANLVKLALLVLFPAIALWLPATMRSG